MIAAIYARKSTEQTGVSEEEKSVTRQIECARAYAVKRGWTVAEDHVCVDDGISGAEFVKRPGFIRLMNALKPRPPFQVLIMSEESRLGREQIETAYALKQIMDAGVRVFFYLEDRERTLDTAMDKVMLSLTNFAGEMERERAKQRTFDAMLRKAKAGHVTGGKVYGYDNQDVCSSDGRRLHVLRVVNQKEAAVVRRVFEMYAASLGITRIAKRLNGEGVPAPRQGPNGWAPSAVREMLHRPLYRGEIQWGEYQKVVRGGTMQRRRREEKDWVRLEAPDLQIVPPDLWNAVHARLARAKDRAHPTFRDLDSKYLLTGMARCASCGGPMSVVGHNHSRKKGKFYACSYYWKRGSSICKNSLVVEQELTDQVVLKAIADALDERMLAVAVEKALERLRAGQEAKLDRRSAIERELSLIEAHEEHLVDAIANGDPAPPLLKRLKAGEARKQELIAELEHLSGNQVLDFDAAKLKRDLRARMADTRALLTPQVPQTRQIIRKLIESPLRCEVYEEGGQRGYRVTGQGNYLHLLRSPAAPPWVVSPTGFEPVLPA